MVELRRDHGHVGPTRPDPLLALVFVPIQEREQVVVELREGPKSVDRKSDVKCEADGTYLDSLLEVLDDLPVPVEREVEVLQGVLPRLDRCRSPTGSEESLVLDL